MVFMDYSTNEKASNKTSNQQLTSLRDIIYHCEHRYISLFQEENLTTVDAAPKKRISKLDVKVQSLLELICDLKAMEECVLEMKFDTRKAPLGQSEGIRSAPEFFLIYLL